MELNHKLSLLSFGIFWVTYFYILTKIGLINFRYYDSYKLLMPFYLLIYLMNNLNLNRLVFSVINLLSLTLWVCNVII
jgi:succinate-acetate transporter protein